MLTLITSRHSFDDRLSLLRFNALPAAAITLRLPLRAKATDNCLNRAYFGFTGRLKASAWPQLYVTSRQLACHDAAPPPPTMDAMCHLPPPHLAPFFHLISLIWRCLLLMLTFSD
jgi:hypothetical protein